LADTVASEPNIDSIETARVRGDESLDLLLAQVLTVPFVGGVAHLVKMSFQVVKVRVGKPNVEGDDAVWRSWSMLDPTCGWCHNLLDRGLVSTYTGETDGTGERG
jgi:hypothetical protein